jgi:hypothetical protein
MTSQHDRILGPHSIRLAISSEWSIAMSTPENVHTQFPRVSLSVRDPAVLNPMSSGTCHHAVYLCCTVVHKTIFLQKITCRAKNGHFQFEQIKDDDNKNTMRREKYTGELAGVPLFLNYSDTLFYPMSVV